MTSKQFNQTKEKNIVKSQGGIDKSYEARNKSDNSSY